MLLNFAGTILGHALAADDHMTRLERELRYLLRFQERMTSRMERMNEQPLAADPVDRMREGRRILRILRANSACRARIARVEDLIDGRAAELRAAINLNRKAST